MTTPNIIPSPGISAHPIQEAYVVIESTPGYLPDAEPADFVDYSDAVAYANELCNELVKAGYSVDRSWASRDNYFAAYAERDADDLGRYVEVIRDDA